MNTITYILSTIALLFPGYTLKHGHAQQIQCIAAAVYHESRGEPATGQISVAYVVKNRMKSEVYPKNACKVVLQKDQFTNLKNRLVIEDEEAWNRAVMTSIAVYAGLVNDPTNGATMYKNPKTAKAKWNMSKLIKTKKIGNHVFYKEKRLP